MFRFASKMFRYYVFGMAGVTLLGWWIKLPELLPIVRGLIPVLGDFGLLLTLLGDFGLLLTLLVGGMMAIAAIFESLK